MHARARICRRTPEAAVPFAVTGAIGMAPTCDRDWLKESIAKALSWDVFVVEGVVEAIEAAGRQHHSSSSWALRLLSVPLPYACLQRSPSCVPKRAIRLLRPLHC